MNANGTRFASAACCIGLTSLTTAASTLLFADEGDTKPSDVMVCEADAKTARVCSSKPLTSIVLECVDPDTQSIYIVSFEDLDDPKQRPIGQFDAHQGVFSCRSGDYLVSALVKSGDDNDDGPQLFGARPRGDTFPQPRACSASADDCAPIIFGTDAETEEAE